MMLLHNGGIEQQLVGLRALRTRGTGLVWERFIDLLQQRDEHGRTTLRRELRNPLFRASLCPLRELQTVLQIQEWEGTLDVLEHSFRTVERIPSSAPVSVFVAALLHDLGKKDTAMVIGRLLSFRNHEYLGALAAARIAVRLGGTDEVASIFNLIADHMVPVRIERNALRGRYGRSDQLNVDCWMLPLAARSEKQFEELMMLYRANNQSRESADRNLEQKVDALRLSRLSYLHRVGLPMYTPTPFELFQAGMPICSREQHERLLQASIRLEFRDEATFKEWLTATFNFHDCHTGARN